MAITVCSDPVLCLHVTLDKPINWFLVHGKMSNADVDHAHQAHGTMTQILNDVGRMLPSKLLLFTSEN